MPPHDIERLCLAVVPGRGAVEIQPLAAGLISDTYRVVRDGAGYAVKLAADQGVDLGLDLRWEARLLERAASSGLAPLPVYYDPESAVMVSPWVAGQAWRQEDVKHAANIHAIAGLLRRVHALKAPAPPFSRRNVSSRTPGRECSTVNVSVRLGRAMVAGQPVTGLGALSLRQLRMKMSATPEQMAESATLNAGKSYGSPEPRRCR